MRFDNSYARLPESFFERINPVPVQSPHLIRLNSQLVTELNLQLPENDKKLAAFFSGNAKPDWADPIAQAYASTQGFVKVVWLDGRVAGITAVGHHVSGFTTAAAMIVQEGWTKDDIHKVVFPHPSLDEALLGALKAEQK